MSNATNLSKLANLLDDGTSGQALVSDGASNVAFETLSTSNVSEGTNLYFTDERVQTKLGSVSGNVVPDTNVAYDLGSAAYAFKDLYLSGSTISLGSLQLSDNGGSLEVSPAGGGSAEPFATETYVTTQVNNLIDAAPGTLDTLNELAAALGDDANFSTTVTNSIAAKANTASLATVATSGSFSDLTGKPTTIAGYGITDAGGGGGGGNVVEYTSTNTAATNDIVMLNTDGTVTVVEPTNYPFDQQTAIDSQMTSGYIADLNYRGMIAHHSTREKGMLIFPGGTGHNDRTMLVVFSRNGSGISKGTAFSSGEPINNFRDQHAFFGPAGTHEDKFLYLGAATSGGNINVGTGNITGTTVNTTGTDSSAAYSNTTNNGQLNIGLNGRMVVDHGGFNGTVLTFYVKFENSNNKAAVRKFTYDFANQNLDYSFPEIETSSSETFEWEHTAIDPSTPTRIALYRQEGVTSTRRGIIKFADVDWDAGTINIGPSADLFTRSGSHNVDAWEIQNKQAFHPTNGLLAAVTTSPPDGGGDAPYRLKVALYSADANLSITNVSGNLTLMNGANVRVGSVRGNIAWTKGSNTGSTPNAPILITPIISNQNGSSPQTRYLQYDNSGNYITQTTDSNTFDSGSMWTYSSPFNDGDTASYSPDTVNSQYPQVIMTQGPYGESNFDATKLHGVAASAGTTIDVTLEYGIHTGLSGLTTGTKYFVTDSGGISTSGSAKLGTAINATSLALDFTDELTSTDLGTYATKAYVGTEISIKANTADLSTVATSGSYNDLTNQPTIPTNNNQLTNGAGFITAADIPSGGNVVEYTSSPNASVNDIVMLNSNGTVTPVQVTTYKTNKDVPQAQIIPNSTGWVYNQTNGAYDQSSDNAVLFPLGITNKYFFMGRDDSSGTAELSGAIVDWTGTTTNSGSWSTWNNPGWTYGTKYSGQSGFGGFARPAFSNKEKPFVLPSPLDANKFLLVQRLHNSEKVIAQIGTITGSTVAWSNHTELDIAIHSASYVRHLYDPANSSSGNYAFYTVVNSNSSGRVRIVRGIWDGNTTITFGPGTSSGDHNGWQFPSDAIDPRSISFSKITANRCTAVNRTTGEIAIYDLSTTINSTTSAVTKGTAQPLSSFQWDGTDLAAHTSWNYNRDEFVVWWRTAGNTQDNNSIMQNYEVSSTNPVYPIAKGTNLNLANHIQFKNGDFEFISGSDTIFTTYLQEWIGLGGEHSHRAVISIDPSSGNLTTLDKDIAYSQDTGEPGVFSLANNNNAQFEGTISVDHFRKGQAVMTNPHYNNSTVWQVAGSPIVGTYVQSNIDATKIHGIAATSGSSPDVTVEGGIHTGLSGLTAGTTYFVLENGTISATADTHNARLGIAMTSTSLAVDLVNELTSTSLATYATKAYVDTATANLVDSSPATLDTLNELAAALGDDANFATTVTNSLANKADTSSLATVATSGSYNDLTNQPTIPTINTSVTTVSSPTVSLDLNNSNFKIDLNGNSTTVTTSNNPSTGLHEYTFEIKGNASQDTHNLQSNPSNAITNWRTAQQSSITGFTVGVSNYNAFAASPDGQYAAAYQAYSSSNKQLTIFKMSTPGDVTTATSHLVINNISVSAGGRTDRLAMRPSIYFLSDNVTINMFGKTYNAETGSNNNNGAGSHSPFYEFSNKGNWTPDGLHFYAPTGDPSFNKIKRWDATAPFDWSTASLVSTTTMTYQSNSVMSYYGPDKAVHVSGDGTKLIAVGKYISNNHSNYAIDTYSLSTPFDPASATYVGQYTVANGGAIHFGSFTNDGNTYMYSDDDRLKSFTNLATTPVLNTITWPGNFYWEGGSAPAATPNDETDIVRFTTTDSGSTFNAWVEKDSDKSAGFDGQYSSLTGSPTLSTVATSGSYNDLTNQPTIPSLTGYATETYVNTATANLVDSAPATLDTLNELAAALGDDANFSTTILAQLGTVSANTISNASNINAVQANLSASASTAAVTVSGGNFYIDGAQQTTISLEPGRTYKFDQSDSTNSSHPLRFSTTSDGTHGGGSEYTTGVTTSGTAGSASAYVQIAVDNSTPALYYYCANHSGMGASVAIGNPFNTDELTEGTSNLYYTDARVDARISGGISANLNITSSPIKKYARLELPANQSISSTTQTILNFNTRSEDNSTANLLTTTLADGKFIIPAGVTKVRLKASAEGSSVTDQFIIKIMKNGANAVTTNFDISSTGGDFPAVFTGIESVVEGDYFQVSAYSQNSRTVNVSSLTWFELEVLEGSILDTTVSANVALADLNNVSNTAPADGQALIWNTSQSNWAPANVASGGSSVSVSDTAPSSPSNGDQWFNSADGSMYIYYADGSSNQWVSVSGPAGSSVSVGTTPPSGAANGDQWFNSDSATLYVYYADGSSSQWVAVSGPRGPQGPAAENAVTTGKAIAMSIVFG